MTVISCIGSERKVVRSVRMGTKRQFLLYEIGQGCSDGPFRKGGDIDYFGYSWRLSVPVAVWSEASALIASTLTSLVRIPPEAWLFIRAFYVSRGSSVSIVSGYVLDDRAIGARSPAGAKDFLSNLCVQTGSGANPAFCTMGTEGSFPGAKRGWGVTLITHPHLVPRSIVSRSYSFSRPNRHHGV
jgi:hypothetical protein